MQFGRVSALADGRPTGVKQLLPNIRKDRKLEATMPPQADPSPQHDWRLSTGNTQNTAPYNIKRGAISHRNPTNNSARRPEAREAPGDEDENSRVVLDGTVNVTLMQGVCRGGLEAVQLAFLSWEGREHRRGVWFYTKDGDHAPDLYLSSRT